MRCDTTEKLVLFEANFSVNLPCLFHILKTLHYESCDANMTFCDVT